jgi:hypothetical protein
MQIHGMLGGQVITAQIAHQALIRRRVEVDGGVYCRLLPDCTPTETRQDATVHRLDIHWTPDDPRLHEVSVVLRRECACNGIYSGASRVQTRGLLAQSQRHFRDCELHVYYEMTCLFFEEGLDVECPSSSPNSAEFRCRWLLHGFPAVLTPPPVVRLRSVFVFTRALLHCTRALPADVGRRGGRVGRKMSLGVHERRPGRVPGRRPESGSGGHDLRAVGARCQNRSGRIVEHIGPLPPAAARSVLRLNRFFAWKAHATVAVVRARRLVEECAAAACVFGELDELICSSRAPSRLHTQRVRARLELALLALTDVPCEGAHALLLLQHGCALFLREYATERKNANLYRTFGVVCAAEFAGGKKEMSMRESCPGVFVLEKLTKI